MTITSDFIALLAFLPATIYKTKALVANFKKEVEEKGKGKGKGVGKGKETCI